MISMNADIRAEWLKRLRSGDVGQCSGTLRVTDHEVGGKAIFCCLGVLSDIAAERKVGSWDSNDHFISIVRTEEVETFYNFDEEDETQEYEETTVVEKEVIDDDLLPVAVREWAGLSDAFGTNGDLPHMPLTIRDGCPNGLTPCLADFNDEGLTFPQIADIIEYAIDPKEPAA